MLETIFIGMSGLTGYSKGLRVIGNNLTNMNTPGFKASQLQFANLFYQGSSSGEAGAQGSAGTGMQLGTGINTPVSVVNFNPGEVRQTGNDLDLAISGDGLFVLRKDNQTHYSRAGQFKFDDDGYLVSKTSGMRVAVLDDAGQLSDVSLDGLRSNSPKATTTIKMTGNLSNNASSDVVVSSVKVIDPAGGEHVMKLTFKNNSATKAGEWIVTMNNGTADVGSGKIQFTNGSPDASANKITLTYSPSGVAAFPITLDFSADVTSFSAGNTSTLAVKSQDGFAGGTLTKVTFDADGKLSVTYSNGQTATGARLALATIASTEDIVQLGGGEFSSKREKAVQLGYANSKSFGSVSAGVVEGSNVDMAEEFSELIVMQRGYQASSHVISAANEMIQELFDMKGHR